MTHVAPLWPLAFERLGMYTAGAETKAAAGAAAGTLQAESDKMFQVESADAAFIVTPVSQHVSRVTRGPHSRARIRVAGC